MKSIKHAFILPSLCFLMVLTAHGEEQFMDFYKKGKEAMAHQEYRKAIDFLEQAIAKKPQSEESVRTYGVQFEGYHPYTLLGEAYIWVNSPDSYEKAKKAIALAFEYGENDSERFPDLKNKTERLKSLIDLILAQKDQQNKPEIPLDSVFAPIREGDFSEALSQVELLIHSFPNEELLETWRVLLTQLSAQTNRAIESEQEHQSKLNRFVSAARLHKEQGEAQLAYKYYLYVDQLDPGNSEAATFIENFTKNLELEGKTQEEITQELESYISENSELLAQLREQSLRNKKAQKELETLKRKVATLRKKGTDIQPGIDVAWNLVPVPDKDRVFHIGGEIRSNTPLKSLRLFINGTLVKSWDIQNKKEFLIPTVSNYIFLNNKNTIRVEAVDVNQHILHDTMTQNISRRRNPLVVMLPKILLFISLFSISYYYLTTQRKRRIAFRERFNPYIAGAPVYSNSMFFGRHDLVKQILNTLHNNSMMICGERRIGKTSFLHRLYALLPLVEDPDYEFFPVLIDLQGIEEYDFFTTLDHEIHETLREKGITLEAEDVDNLDVRNFTRRIRAVISALKNHAKRTPKLVLLLDEVDVMNRFSERTNQQLRSVFMKGFATHLVAVMAGINIKKRWESEGSPWYNFFEQIELEPFTERHAKALIELPVKGIYHYTEEAVAQILEYSRMKPYLIQRICVNLLAHILTENRRRIHKKDVDHVFHSLKKDEGP